MPNQQGFNLFRDGVACIDCDVRGPYSEWTEKKQIKHRLDHEKAEAVAAQKRAQQRARDARRLAQQAARENDLAYGKGKSSGERQEIHS